MIRSSAKETNRRLDFLDGTQKKNKDEAEISHFYLTEGW